MKAKIGSAVVSITRGDITEAEVDAIVNAANAELSMGAGVAGAMKRKGGTVIEEDAIRQGPIEVGEAVLTVAGNLPATHVIHAATMGADHKPDPAKIGAATKSSLDIADKHRLSSIAFPALGTGPAGVGATHSAEAMLSTVVQHLKTGNSSLQKVVFVLYQDEAHKAFTDALKRLTGVH
jgi:O-acetyl-ADP-ribose deacetylase